MHSKSQTDKSEKKKSPLEVDFNEPADFDTAVTASGFGRFNVLLLLVACPAAMASVIETAVVSYILPSAECDLHLDLIDKGILNAVTYLGMIVSAVGWGYLADTKGRKKLLVLGFLVDVVCTACSAMSQNFTQFMISKFFGGFVMCGPFAILISYLSEFHGNKHREQIIMIIGVMFSTASIMLPVMAMMILPKDWNFDIFNMNFTSWKIYLAICGIPSLISGILLCLFPESPRFLMSQGRNFEALNIFKSIYAINTGNPKDTYPIKELANENPTKKANDPNIISVATIEGAVEDVHGHVIKGDEHTDDPSKQPSAFRALCVKPYLSLSLLVYLMNYFILFGQITMRLWLPQLFASMYEYRQISSETTSMCTILEYNVNKTTLMRNPVAANHNCNVVITSDTYTNNIIVAGVNMIGYSVAGSLVNCVGHKRIQVFGLTIAGICGLALYWSSSALTTLIITTTYICMGSIASKSTIGSSVSLFPTSLRTMIISLSLMFGRMGSITGNILFPIFMTFGCIPPFLMIGSVMFIGCILGACLPSTKNSDLK